MSQPFPPRHTKKVTKMHHKYNFKTVINFAKSTHTEVVFKTLDDDFATSEVIAKVIPAKQAQTKQFALVQATSKQLLIVKAPVATSYRLIGYLDETVTDLPDIATVTNSYLFSHDLRYDPEI